MSYPCSPFNIILLQFQNYSTFWWERIAHAYVRSMFGHVLHCDYWNRGHPDNVDQSQGRPETKDSNIFKSSQSNVEYRTLKSQLVCWPEMNKKRNEKQPPNLNIFPQSFYLLFLFWTATVYYSMVITFQFSSDRFWLQWFRRPLQFTGKKKIRILYSTFDWVLSVY